MFSVVVRGDLTADAALPLLAAVFLTATECDQPVKHSSPRSGQHAGAVTVATEFKKRQTGSEMGLRRPSPAELPEPGQPFEMARAGLARRMILS